MCVFRHIRVRLAGIHAQLSKYLPLLDLLFISRVYGMGLVNLHAASSSQAG